MTIQLLTVIIILLGLPHLAQAAVQGLFQQPDLLPDQLLFINQAAPNGQFGISQ